MLTTKHCNKCGKSLPEDQFYKDSTKHDGLQSNCIPCRRKAKGITQREKQREKQRKEIERERRIIKQFKDHWRSLAFQWTGSEIYKKWAKMIKLEQIKRWQKENPEKVKAKGKKWRDNNKDFVKQIRNDWERKNRERRLAYKRENSRKRRIKNKDNPLAIAQKRVRDRTLSAFKAKRWQKRSKTREMLGCSKDMLVTYIESQFTKGMGWHNRGEWHIDHIIPLSSASTVEELEKLAHFSNLRPMWANENMAKGAKIIECQPELALTH